MADAIEILVWKLPGGAPSAVRQVVAQATLHEVDGGHGIYARLTGPEAWERRGFLAGHPNEEIWRLVARAAYWAATAAQANE